MVKGREKGERIMERQKRSLKHVNVKGYIRFEASKMYIKEFICSLELVGRKISQVIVNTARYLPDQNPLCMSERVS
jgi:hypothetical protein